MDIRIEVEDVKGSFARLIADSPKIARRLIEKSVYETAVAVKQEMVARAPFGPEGEGEDPMEHIKQDIEVRGRGLGRDVGIFDDPEDVSVAIFNEYSPNRQPFMRPAKEAQSGPFKKRVEDALAAMERELSQGV